MVGLFSIICRSLLFFFLSHWLYVFTSFTLSFLHSCLFSFQLCFILSVVGFHCDCLCFFLALSMFDILTQSVLCIPFHSHSISGLLLFNLSSISHHLHFIHILILFSLHLHCLLTLVFLCLLCLYFFLILSLFHSHPSSVSLYLSFFLILSQFHSQTFSFSPLLLFLYNFSIPNSVLFSPSFFLIFTRKISCENDLWK